MLKNPHNFTITTSFSVQATFFNPSDVILDKEYQNIVQYGQFLRYEINPVTNPLIQPYLSKLKIKLYSMLGDADLFVSFTTPTPDYGHHQYRSMRSSMIDEVSIE